MAFVWLSKWGKRGDTLAAHVYAKGGRCIVGVIAPSHEYCDTIAGEDAIRSQGPRIELRGAGSGQTFNNARAAAVYIDRLRGYGWRTSTACQVHDMEAAAVEH